MYGFINAKKTSDDEFKPIFPSNKSKLKPKINA
jgi:hypothetical protein